MAQLSLREAKLFRLLARLFGTDNIVHGMSVLAVCGGSLPESCNLKKLSQWAEKHKCLFTIVNNEGEARMVLEFLTVEGEIIDATDIDHHKNLSPILKAAEIPFVTVSDQDLEDLQDPGSGFNLCDLLRDKLDLPSLD